MRGLWNKVFLLSVLVVATEAVSPSMAEAATWIGEGIDFTEDGGELVPFGVDDSAACNGGSCLGSDDKVYQCPTSAGPTCKSNELCVCECGENENGVFTMN